MVNEASAEAMSHEVSAGAAAAEAPSAGAAARGGESVAGAKAGSAAAAEVLPDGRPWTALNALPANVAVLDDHGTIVWVNTGWQTFATENGWADPAAGLGMNYLAVATQARGRWSKGAGPARRLLADVLDGKLAAGDLTYACDGPNEHRMFRMVVSRFERTPGIGVMHLRVADRRAAHLRPSADRLLGGIDLVCAWCGFRFDETSLSWRPRVGRLSHQRPVTHGICDSCVAQSVLEPSELR